MMVQNAKEVEDVLLRMDEIERRIAQIEEVTKGKGRQDILKMEVEQVRIEMANLRGISKRYSFIFQRLISRWLLSRGMLVSFSWLEEADLLEETLGLETPSPSSPAESNQPNNEDKNVAQQPVLEQDKATNQDSPQNPESTERDKEGATNPEEKTKN